MHKIKPKHFVNSTMAINIGTPQPIAKITRKLQVDFTSVIEQILVVCAFSRFSISAPVNAWA